MACALCGAVWSWRLGVVGSSVVVETEFCDSVSTRGGNLWVHRKRKKHCSNSKESRRTDWWIRDATVI